MNYNKLLNNCINEFPVDEPIFIEDIKDYLSTKMEFSDKKMKTIYVYINRLVKANVLDFFSKGVYYRAKIGKFGKKKLDINKVIERKYLKYNNQIKGYITGATLYNSLGLTTLLNIIKDGKDNVVTDIIKATRVPIGTPFENKASAIGKTPNISA